jgi:hypothetical protein
VDGTVPGRPAVTGLGKVGFLAQGTPGPFPLYVVGSVVDELVGATTNGPLTEGLALSHSSVSSEKKGS